jgi:hypothetical protein
MAIADGALFGYKSIAELREQQIPEGEDELPLRFHVSALNRPILRKYTQAHGVTEEPMPLHAFLDIWRSTLVNADYLWGPSMHAVRRNLGKGIDGKCKRRARAKTRCGVGLTDQELNRAVHRGAAFSTHHAIRSARLRAKLCR